MIHVLILIPSYKRPEVLDLTLKGLSENTGNVDFKVNVAVGLLQSDEKSKKVANKYEKKFIEKSVGYRVVSYDKNIGKAACLNDLYERFQNSSGYIVTLDNDMVIKKPWLHLIHEIKTLDFDVMGFGSFSFWAHDPRREDCKILKVNFPNTYYHATSVAGGMMVMPRKFMALYKWTNHGGVYGRDDQDICLRTGKKYVLMWPVDWLDHDPLSGSTPELKTYEEKKKDLYARGITVFPEGWDEA